MDTMSYKTPFYTAYNISVKDHLYKICWLNPLTVLFFLAQYVRPVT